MVKNKEKAIKIAKNHEKKYYKMPSVYTYSSDINWFYRCYASIAARNIVEAIEEISNPAFILDMLQSSVDTANGAACDTNGDASFMFSVFADVGTDFIDLFLTSK